MLLQTRRGPAERSVLQRSRRTCCCEPEGDLLLPGAPGPSLLGTWEITNLRSPGTRDVISCSRREPSTIAQDKRSAVLGNAANERSSPGGATEFQTTIFNGGMRP